MEDEDSTKALELTADGIVDKVEETVLDPESEEATERTVTLADTADELEV